MSLLESLGKFASFYLSLVKKASRYYRKNENSNYDNSINTYKKKLFFFFAFTASHKMLDTGFFSCAGSIGRESTCTVLEKERDIVGTQAGT